MLKITGPGGEAGVLCTVCWRRTHNLKSLPAAAIKSLRPTDDSVKEGSTVVAEKWAQRSSVVD